MIFDKDQGLFMHIEYGSVWLLVIKAYFKAISYDAQQYTKYFCNPSYGSMGGHGCWKNHTLSA